MTTYIKLYIPLIYQLKDSDTGVELWRLNWIGGNFFDDSKMYCILYFTDYSTLLHEQQIGSGKVFKVKLESYMQAYFCIGCIFDRAGQLVSRPCDDQNYDSYTYEINGSLNPRSGFAIGDILREVPLSAGASEMYYFEIQKLFEGQNINIIIPVLEICRYFYFNYPILAKYILDYKFNKILYSPKINGRAATVIYDNKLVSYFEIEKIVQFLFLEENLGLKSINKIGADIRFRRIAGNSDDINRTYYPFTILPFKGRANMKFHGKEYSQGGDRYLFVNQIEEIFITELQRELIFSLDIKAQFSYGGDYSVLLRNRRKTADYALVARHEKEIVVAQNVKMIDNMFLSDNPFLTFFSKTHIIDIPEKPISTAGLAVIAKNIRRKSLEEKNTEFVQEYSEAVVALISKIFPAEYAKLQTFKLKENRHIVFFKNKSREVTVAEIRTDKGYFYIINFASDFSVLISNSILLEKFKEIDLRLVMNKFVIDYLLNRIGIRQFLKDKKNEYKRKYRITIHRFMVYRHKNESELVSRAKNDAQLIIDEIKAYGEAAAS